MKHYAAPKGYQLEHVDNCLKWMTKHGMPLTIMVGYYRQTKQLDQTVREVKRLMFSASMTLQVTFCTPLDYTPYHKEQDMEHTQTITTILICPS